jgi:hypothetical protein
MKCSSIGFGRWAKKVGDELRPEYDQSQLKGGVRGKYYTRAMAGTMILRPDGETVHDAFFDRSFTP